MDKLLFKAEVRKQLALRKWSYVDLAEHTTYSSNSIAQLLYDNPHAPRELTSKFVDEIASALDIDISKLK